MKALKHTIITIITLAIIASTIHFFTVQASTQPTPTPKPSTPKFTIKLVDYSYYIPPTYSVDPYTGENVTITEGRQIDKRSIEVNITNQFARPIYGQLYYQIRLKGHYEDKWTYAPEQRYYGYHIASDTEYTIVLLNRAKYDLESRRAESKIDFQVQRLLGNEEVITTITQFGEGHLYEFTGEADDWSEIQTITIPSSIPTPTPSIEPTSTTKEIEAILGATIIIKEE